MMDKIPPENEDDLRYAPSSESAGVNDDTAFVINSDSLDIDAALAAVASLDDLLAEQEAAEQARIAREQAEAEARAERQARLQNPEMFFPMPPLATLQRGRVDSLVPAIVLIGIGAWLTLTLTSGAIFNPSLVMVVALAGLGITFLARWMASGRWSGGNLFFALLVLLMGGATFAIANTIGLASGWPLLFVAIGVTFILTSVLNRQRRLMFPGVVIIFAGITAYFLTNGAWLP